MTIAAKSFIWLDKKSDEKNGGCGGFLKWWYPTTMDFPTKNYHFGVFSGYHHLRKHPCFYWLEVSCREAFWAEQKVLVDCPPQAASKSMGEGVR